jgi:uncharacterized protein with HEPN domain
MSDRLLIERLESILEALERIPRRFAGIERPTDFLTSEAGHDSMDGICMVLVAVGEEFKAIDRKTEGKLLDRYPLVRWRGVMGVRDLLAHAYFQVNVDHLFSICRDDIPQLIATVHQMIQDLEHGAA